jgi:hypothetical protein
MDSKKLTVWQYQLDDIYHFAKQITELGDMEDSAFALGYAMSKAETIMSVIESATHGKVGGKEVKDDAGD